MHLSAKLLALVAVLACAAVLVAPAAANVPPLRGPSQSCKEMKWAYINRIKVQKVGCKEARGVIVRYTRLMNKRLQHDWEITIRGWTCDLTGRDYYGDSHRCRASGGRAISFRRGTH